MKDAPPPPRIFKLLKFNTIKLPKIKIIPHTSDFFFFGSTQVYVSNSFAAITHSVMQIEITTFLLIC